MKVNEDYERLTISEKADIVTALKKLNETAKKVLLVSDKGKLLGTLTDGDIRRYILKTGKIEGKVKDAYCKNPIVFYEDELKSLNTKDIKRTFKKHKIELIPVIDREGYIKGYIEWSQIIENGESIALEKVSEDIPVVIMAGGKGTRLKPFTEVLPKPLVPVGEKTIIERILEQFSRYGIRKFIVTVNYKAEIIESFLKSLNGYEIEFIREKEFLGTAGSLKYLEDSKYKTFIVSNCDILVNVDIKKLLEFHKESRASMTLVTSIMHHKIPYGVVEIEKGGEVRKIKEKPEYTFQIITGVYVINKDMFKYIPKDKPFDMPELIEEGLKNGEKIMVYPVKESDYLDIGTWEEYKKTLKRFLEVFYV